MVATQLAAVGVLIGAVNGTPALAAATAVAGCLLAVTWVRARGRWSFEWLAVALGFAGRRRFAPSSAGAGTVLRVVAPRARVEPTDRADASVAVIVDDTGLTSVLELGHPSDLLAGGAPALPTPATLVPPAGPDQPPVLIQLILTGTPAPAARADARLPAASYRQLTGADALGYSRSLLAVRVMRAEGWSEDELRRSLSSLMRKLMRRLATVPAQPMGDAATVRAIAELAHDDGSGPLRETWSDLRIGGLTQATFRLDRLPDVRVEPARGLIDQMLALPATATTVSVSAGPGSPHGPPPIDLTVRLAAPGPAALSETVQALRAVLSAEHVRVRRLDGEHLHGLRATLPLGGTPAAVPGLRADAHPPDRVEALHLSAGAAGLMLGRDRHGDPVVIRLFRPEQTRVLMVGGARCAQLLALRAIAVGARVVVQTARPQVWVPFVRGAAVPGESIAVVLPRRAFDPVPASALRPLLVVVDDGPGGVNHGPGGVNHGPGGVDHGPGGVDHGLVTGWQTTLVVRDEFGAADAEIASRSDLLILQPLRPAEASLLDGVLGLGDAAQWMTRIRSDMVAVVNRRSVRWAALAQTPIEHRLIGAATR